MVKTLLKGAATPRVVDQHATVFVVDDDPDVRRSVALLARSVDLFAEQFSNGKEFLEQFRLERSGCLVIDMRMPGMSGLELQRELAQRNCCLPIIFITAHGEISNATEAMRAGAIDFLRKPYNPQMLLERIHEGIALNHLQRTLLQQRCDVQASVATLTEREHEIMQLFAKGDSSKLIASRLGISTKTVDNHRAKVLDKMGVDNVAQLARIVACLIAVEALSDV